MQDVEVKKSAIHGIGVFALRDFKKGEIVLKWNPMVLTKTEAEKILGKEKDYINFHEGKYLLMQPPERFVNHSCDANTFTKNFCDIAKRDIVKGEEITSNYNNEGCPLDITCNCGSKNCVGNLKR